MDRQLRRDGLALCGMDVGNGLPVLFQHGLGGDEAQVAETFPDNPGIRRLTLECRAHGASDAGDPRSFSLGTFADDILAFLDSAGIDRFVAGGISMGAALALSLAVRFPDRVQALILVRPSWIWQSAPENMRPFREVAAILRKENDSDAALAAFEASETAQRLAKDAPDNLVSLRKFFARPASSMTADLLEAIATDGPGVSEAEIAALHAPTLIVGTEVDAIHPIEFARALAVRIPHARLAAVTPKAVDRVRNVHEVREALGTFLDQYKPFEPRAGTRL